MRRYNVGVVGAGYVGLVTAATLSHVGHHVACVDKDERRVALLRQGGVPFHEPGLGGLMTRTREGLRFETELELVVCGADVVFIAVGTPQGEDGSADLSGVGAVARGIGRALANAPPEARRGRPLVVVNKSTVPVGSGDYVSMLILEGLEEAGGGDENFVVASSPEFLREGSAIYDSFFPDRIVVGTDSKEALEVLRNLYAPIIEQSFPTELDPRPKVAVPFVTTDLASAEMIKYAANAFLATKISFINEIANLCEFVGADVTEVAYGIGLDGRIGPRFLNAGIGWGGSCFPKDVSALRAAAREYDYETRLLDATVAVNERQRKRVIQKLQRELRTIKGKRVALLGLSFKPNTDDLREAASLEIARALCSLGARVVGYDPVAGKVAARLMPEMKVVFDPYEALNGAHAAVVVTEWEEVRELDLKGVASLMRQPPVLIDGRNAMD
ncbi:MAG: UDP-glucose/GDP-mannose dehydrogenase family protein, partial [Actinomycetota bacterium]|nr:UDP-glucose/GDP-mannose dehydrogenase family protein [Actinomycetota bacterium]